MEHYLEEFHCQKDIVSLFCGSISTKKVLEAIIKQLTLDIQEKWESHPAWNNLQQL